MVYRDGSTKPAKMSNLSNASPVRAPHNMDYKPRHDGPVSPRVVMR